MKTLNKKNIEALKNSGLVIERLAFALISHGVPVEDFENIANYGAQNGYPAISYYFDTCEFYNSNKDDIWNYVVEQAEEFGENVFEFIGHFNGVKHVGSCHQFENLMTWYIAEKLGMLFEVVKSVKEKTMLEWLQQLPEPYRTQAIDNVEPLRLLLTGYSGLSGWSSGVLPEAFVWSYTPEGKEYWKELHNTLLMEEGNV